MDHIAADTIGGKTPFPTLELSCNDHRDNIELIYFDNMSWYGTGHVAPSMRDPRQVYDRLFGIRANSRNRTINDLALGNARQLRKRLGRADQAKFEEYFDAVRSIETRMDRIDLMKAELQGYRVERPVEVMPRNDYLHVMGDLMVTALQAGLTNVSTLMVAPERWGTQTNYEGILDGPRNHHSMTHNQSKCLEDLLTLDRFHVGVFARMVEKMDQIEEADGTSLLDNTIFTLGAGIGDGAAHQYNDLPVVVAGGGGGQLKLGRHIHVERGTPLANLWLTQLKILGVAQEQFADSNNTLSSILV